VKAATTERLAALVCLLPGLGIVVWTGAAIAFPWVAAASAMASLVAASGLLAWLAGGEDSTTERWVSWALGLAAGAIVGVGSAAEYNLWFSDSRPWTVVCHLTALLAVAAAGSQRGWVGGLRASMVALLTATAAVLAVFRGHLGVREQPAVFQAAGLLDAYDSSGNGDFTAWVTQAFLGGVLPRTVVVLVCGAGLGALVGWLVSRFGPGRDSR